MIELKQFVFEVEKMRGAQKRLAELEMRSPSVKAVADMKEITDHLEQSVDQSIEEANRQLRIAPEQVNADAMFNEAIQKALKQWYAELDQVQREQTDQAIQDTKAGGGKSLRLSQLEQRELELKASIREGEERLGKVAERARTPFAQMVEETVNKAKKEDRNG